MVKMVNLLCIFYHSFVFVFVFFKYLNRDLTIVVERQWLVKDCCERTEGFLAVDWDFFSLGYWVDDWLVFTEAGQGNEEIWGATENITEWLAIWVEKQLKSEEDLVYSEKRERQDPKTGVGMMANSRLTDSSSSSSSSSSMVRIWRLFQERICSYNKL